MMEERRNKNKKNRGDEKKPHDLKLFTYSMSFFQVEFITVNFLSKIYEFITVNFLRKIYNCG